MIINPVSKQRVLLHSKEGNEVFRNYLESLNNLQQGGSVGKVRRFLQNKINHREQLRQQLKVLESMSTPENKQQGLGLLTKGGNILHVNNLKRELNSQLASNTSGNTTMETQQGGGTASLFNDVIGITGVKKNFIKYIQPMSTEHFSQRLMNLTTQNLHQSPRVLVGGRNFNAVYDLIQQSKQNRVSKNRIKGLLNYFKRRHSNYQNIYFQDGAGRNIRYRDLKTLVKHSTEKPVSNVKSIASKLGIYQIGGFDTQPNLIFKHSPLNKLSQQEGGEQEQEQEQEEQEQEQEQEEQELESLIGGNDATSVAKQSIPENNGSEGTASSPEGLTGIHAVDTLLEDFKVQDKFSKIGVNIENYQNGGDSDSSSIHLSQLDTQFSDSGHSMNVASQHGGEDMNSSSIHLSQVDTHFSDSDNSIESLLNGGSPSELSTIDMGQLLSDSFDTSASPVLNHPSETFVMDGGDGEDSISVENSSSDLDSSIVPGDTIDYQSISRQDEIGSQDSYDPSISLNDSFEIQTNELVNSQEIGSQEQVPEMVSTNEVPNVADGGIDHNAAADMAASSPKSINQGIQEYYTNEPGNVEVGTETADTNGEVPASDAAQTGGEGDENAIPKVHESLFDMGDQEEDFINAGSPSSDFNTESNFEYNTSDI